jgi:hypothetical protein
MTAPAIALIGKPAFMRRYGDSALILPDRRQRHRPTPLRPGALGIETLRASVPYDAARFVTNTTASHS